MLIPKIKQYLRPAKKQCRNNPPWRFKSLIEKFSEILLLFEPRLSKNNSYVLLLDVREFKRFK